MASPSKSDEPRLALTASGREIALPRSAAGPAVGQGGTLGMMVEAQSLIQRGDLAEALIWIERSSPYFDGLVRLSQRGA